MSATSAGVIQNIGGTITTSNTPAFSNAFAVTARSA